MAKLLSFEFRKLFRQKSFYICLGIALFMGVVTLRTFSKNSFSSYDVLVSLVKAYGNCSLTMLFGIFAAIYVCDDYSAGTIRNIVTRGYTRTNIYLAKLITLCFAAVIMLLTCWIVSAFAGVAFFGSGTSAFSASFIESMAAQFMLFMAYACVFNAVCSALQKTGISVAVCIILPLAVTMILTFIQITFADKGGALSNANLQQYWLDDLVNAVSWVDADKASLDLAFKAAPLYIIGSMALGWLSIARREY